MKKNKIISALLVGALLATSVPALGSVSAFAAETQENTAEQTSEKDKAAKEQSTKTFATKEEAEAAKAQLPEGSSDISINKIKKGDPSVTKSEEYDSYDAANDAAKALASQSTDTKEITCTDPEMTPGLTKSGTIDYYPLNDDGSPQYLNDIQASKAASAKTKELKETYGSDTVVKDVSKDHFVGYVTYEDPDTKKTTKAYTALTTDMEAAWEDAGTKRDELKAAGVTVYNRGRSTVFGYSLEYTYEIPATYTFTSTTQKYEYQLSWTAPTEPTKPIEPSKPSDPTKPADPSKPSTTKVITEGNITVRTVTKTDGTVTSSAEIKLTAGKNGKAVISASDIAKIKKLANGSSLLTIRTDKGTALVKVSDLKTGKTLTSFILPKKGVKAAQKYRVMTGKKVKVTSNGSVTIVLKDVKGKSLILENAKDAKVTNNAIKKTLKLSTKKKTLKRGKKYKVKFSSKFNKNNLKKVTYKSSSRKIAKVTKTGKITAKKKGTVKIKAYATLKSGQKKTLTLKVKVR